MFTGATSSRFSFFPLIPLRQHSYIFPSPAIFTGVLDRADIQKTRSSGYMVLAGNFYFRRETCWEFPFKIVARLAACSARSLVFILRLFMSRKYVKASS